MTLENTDPVESQSTDPITEDAPRVDVPEVVVDHVGEAEKANKAMQRRIDRLTRDKYELSAKLNFAQSTPTPRADAALIDDEVETRAESRAREIAEVKAFNDQCNDVHAKGMKASKKFEQSFKAVVEEIGSPFDSRGKPTSVMSAIMDADEPHKLIIHLAVNPELAAELADLSPSKQIRKIAQLERDMVELPRKPSSAPKPITPVTGGSSSTEPDPKDTARWISWENDKLLAARRKK